MHPSPGRPEPDSRPDHQQGSREEDPDSENPVEPATEKKQKQCGDNDRPAENANLAEPRPERGFRVRAPLRLALGSPTRGISQSVEMGFCHEAISLTTGAAASVPGRRYRSS